MLAILGSVAITPLACPRKSQVLFVLEKRPIPRTDQWSSRTALSESTTCCRKFEPKGVFHTTAVQLVALSKASSARLCGLPRIEVLHSFDVALGRERLNLVASSAVRETAMCSPTNHLRVVSNCCGSADATVSYRCIASTSFSSSQETSPPNHHILINTGGRAMHIGKA